MRRDGKLKIESLQNQQPRLAPAKVGRFLGMVMYDNEFETKENKFRPRIKLDHNFGMERWWGAGGRGVG